jgi:hypothetical protein
MGDQVLDGVEAIPERLAVIEARIESPCMKPPFKFARGPGAKLWGVIENFDEQRVLPRQKLSNGNASNASADDHHLLTKYRKVMPCPLTEYLVFWWLICQWWNSVAARK